MVKNKILLIFVKTLFIQFFSCSLESPLDMDPQAQQVSVKNETTKMGKSSPKIKNDRNKSIEFSVNTFFAVVFTISGRKKTQNLG